MRCVFSPDGRENHFCFFLKTKILQRTAGKSFKIKKLK